jgi:hypothetical protein
VWHDLWITEPVPNLMAVGLAVITAVVLLLGLRLVMRKDVTFQHTAIKRDGRLAAGGRLAALLVAAFAVLIGWLTVGKVVRGEAVSAMEALGTRSTPGFEERLPAAEAALARAVWWSPLRDPRLLSMHGLLLRESLRHDQAEAELGEAIARVRHPVMIQEGAMALALYRIRSGDADGARQLALQVLERNPRNATAQRLVEMTSGR